MNKQIWGRCDTADGVGPTSRGGQRPAAHNTLVGNDTVDFTGIAPNTIQTFQS
jgi:hypothetical protein